MAIDCIRFSKDIDDMNISLEAKKAIQLQRDMAELNAIDARTAKAEEIYTSLMKADNPVEAWKNLFRRNTRDKQGEGWEGGTTLGTDQDIIRNEAHRILYALMDDHRPSAMGYFTPFSKKLRAEKDMAVVDAMYGLGVNKDALGYAQSWKRVFDMLDNRFHAAGGSAKRAAQFERVPVSHSMRNIAAASKDDYVRDVGKWLSDDSIDLSVTKENGTPYTKEEILGLMYDRESQNISNVPGMEERLIPGNPSFNFKDAASWKAYNKLYGVEGGMYNAMHESVSSMSHIIAAMEKFGSNPNMGIKHIQKLLKTGASEKGVSGEDIASAFSRVDKISKVSMGALSSTNRMAAGGGTIRNIQTALKLGGAIIPAVTDTVLMFANSAFNGFSGFKVFSRHLKYMATLDGGQRHELASRLGLGLEHMINAAHATNRYSEVYGSGFWARAAGSVMSISGLQGWTVGAKQAFGVEFSAHFSKMLRGSKVLGEAELRPLKTYGLNNKRDLKILKNAKTFNMDGVDFIDPMSLPADVKRKYLSMMLEETKMSVPEADAGVQGWMTMGVEQGTWIGESLRFGTQFKIFPATIIANHWGRAFNKNISKMDRYRYAATNIVGLTVFGTMAVMARDITNGKEPEPLFLKNGDLNMKLLAKGFAQGGAASFLADLAVMPLTKESRFGGNEFLDWIAGPMGGDVQNVAFDIVFGDIHANLYDKKNAASGYETAAKIFGAGMPNIWYGKLLLQREVMDVLYEMSDPKWKKKQRKKRQKMKKEDQRDYLNEWAAPGE